MNNDINNLPTLKEIEGNLFQELQNYFQLIMVSLLEDVDKWLMNNRDYQRYENREIQSCTIDTMFGSITIKRRIYRDRYKGERVALLDKYLRFNGSDSISPFLTELMVDWASRGPSYRDVRDRFIDLLGYQVSSHETIRQHVLKIQPKEVELEPEKKPKKVDTLFLEVDGLHISKQNSSRKSREIKFGIVHEGWEKRHPSSNEYSLVNKSFWHSLDKGEDFWETFSRYLYEHYDITKDTQVIINGDRAPWIRSGVEYFESAMYTYDRYHLKKWIKETLNNRTEEERSKVIQAADANDPVELVVAIAEAEKEEMDPEKKEEIADMRLFILENMDAFRDYREILRKEKGVDTTGMRPMGAAESNMNFFAKRLKGGYSWSAAGVDAMTSAIIHRFEETLSKAIHDSCGPGHAKRKEKRYPSFATLLTEKASKAVGVIKGHIPALVKDDQGKPYTRVLRGLAGLS